jgi:hypothetical protein
MKMRFPQVERRLALGLLILGLVTAPVFAKGKQKNAQDPYATAELETAPAVNAADLVYRVILFEDFVVPAEWEAKARALVNSTEDRAIGRLVSTHAFATVGRKQASLPEDPYLLVKCKLLDYRRVSRTSRILVGVAAGRSYISYHVEVYDGKSNTLAFQREVSTENSVFSGTFSNSDNELSTFLGNVLADYLALRARKDKGVSVLPIENDAQTLEKGKKK